MKNIQHVTKRVVLLRSVYANWTQQLRQYWNNNFVLCMSNALDLFSGQHSAITALFSEIIVCDAFNLMLCSTLISPTAWLCAKNQALVNISISYSSFYPLIHHPQKPEEFRKIVQNSMSALEVYLHLYMATASESRGFCETFSCNTSSHFEWGHSGQNLGLQPTYCLSISEEMMHQSDPSQ